MLDSTQNLLQNTHYISHVDLKTSLKCSVIVKLRCRSYWQVSGVYAPLKIMLWTELISRSLTDATVRVNVRSVHL